jgi:F0F1-type ATP synthase assembly protein I
VVSYRLAKRSIRIYRTTPTLDYRHNTHQSEFKKTSEKIMNNNNENKTKTENENKKIAHNNENSISDTYVIAAHISSIVFEMVIPVLLGIGLDYLLGTVVFFAIIGAIGGTILAFTQLIKIANKYS